MSAPERSGEHWFDRLASARHTRRHGLKTALAAAALTLPLARARPAHAASDTTLCRKGCIYSRQRYTKADLNGCEIKYGTHFYSGMAGTLLFGSFLGVGQAIGGAIARNKCMNRALLSEKYEVEFTCYRPNCPGFDPTSEYGPCQNCPSINGCQCCADPAAPSGYTYCSSLSNYCCNPAGGCKVCGT